MQPDQPGHTQQRVLVFVINLIGFSAVLCVSLRSLRLMDISTQRYAESRRDLTVQRGKARAFYVIQRIDSNGHVA